MIDQTEIRRKLKNFIEDAAVPEAVQYPNFEWDETTSTGYWFEVAMLINPNDRLSLGAATRYSGLMQVTVVGPKGIGTVPHDALANGIAQLFPVDLKIPITDGNIRVISNPTVREGLSDETNWRVPVDIAHEVLNTN